MSCHCLWPGAGRRRRRRRRTSILIYKCSAPDADATTNARCMPPKMKNGRSYNIETTSTTCCITVIRRQSRYETDTIQNTHACTFTLKLCRLDLIARTHLYIHITDYTSYKNQCTCHVWGLQTWKLPNQL